MLIYIGADHRGFQLKENFKKLLINQGYEVIDAGNKVYDENDDYPDFAAQVGKEISLDPISRRGILICGSGVGVDVVANKFRGVRSALITNPDQAYLSRSHNDVNVLSLASDFLDEEQAKKILSTWLQADFSNEPRHQRRLDKIRNIENNL